MQELNLEKLMEKLDNKKVEELAEIIDQLPTLNETLKAISQLKESGALDALINLSYSAKVVRDMLTDDAIENVADMLGGLMDLSEIVSQNSSRFNEFIKHLDTIDDLIHTIQQLKADGALDATVNAIYGLKTLRDMLNNDAIENIASSMSGLLELSSVFNDKYDSIMQLMNNLDVLGDLTSKMKELKANGALDAVFDATYFLKTMKDMLNDEAIANLTTTLSLTLDFLPRGIEFLNHAMSPTLYNMVNSLTSPEAQKMLSDPPKISLGGLVASFRDEDVQRGMGIFITILKILGKNYKINLS